MTGPMIGPVTGSVTGPVTGQATGPGEQAPSSSAWALPGPLLDPQAPRERGVVVTPAGLDFAMDPAGLPQIEGFVVPGLVDLHAHIGLGPQGAVSAQTALAQAQLDLGSGVTVVRDAGSPTDTRFLQGRPDTPLLIRAGRHLAKPKRYLRGFAQELSQDAQLPAAMAEQARSGDGWVKVVGDWIDRDSGDLEPLWDPAALADGIAAAHASGARVTMHTFGPTAAGHGLAAGIDCLEHGTGLHPEQMQVAAARGVPVIPTLLQVANFEQFAAAAGKFPRFATRMRKYYERRYEQVRQLQSAGVRLLFGTDAGGTIAHGQVRAELGEWVAAGLDARTIVAGASTAALEFLGVPALQSGAPANLVVLAQDPRQNPLALANPRAIFRHGRLVFAGSH